MRFLTDVLWVHSRFVKFVGVILKGNFCIFHDYDRTDTEPAVVNIYCKCGYFRWGGGFY